jgi:lysophospholipid acyltransferase (LPLAT)-like uncharacterized protein
VRRLAPPIAAALVHLLGASLRIRVAGDDRLAPFWSGGRPVIYALWHGRILLAPWLNARLRRSRGARTVAVLASRSHDGELLAAFARRFGLAVVRGSSSRGGAAALRGLVAAVAEGHDVAVAPDGPRGPRGRVQRGVVTLAALSGAPIVPMAVACRPARRLRSWDEFLVPWPFAHCQVVFGEPWRVARDADRDGARLELERALVDVTAAADRAVAP